MNYRCFIALEAVDPLRDHLEEHLRRFRPRTGVNWVKNENLHLTLLFLGDVDSTRMPELEEIVDECVCRRRPLWLSLRGLDLFPAKSPRLIWASLDARDDEPRLLHKGLLSQTRQAGFEPDSKPLRLHITLGRIKRQLPVWLEEEILQSEVDSAWQPHTAVTLYRSVLKPEGPTYHVLNQYIIP